MPDPDRALRTEQIWLFSKQTEFTLYQAQHGHADLALDPYQYRSSAGHPETRQKNQVVLHYTAANNPAASSISYWNSLASMDPWVCPRYSASPPHHYGGQFQYKCPQAGCGWQGNGSQTCPTHHVRTPIMCPNGHGALIQGRKYGSAHYVAEVSQDRTSASQLYSDIVEVMPSNTVTFHAQHTNDVSVGIEIVNCGWEWVKARHDTFTGSGANQRPVDRNRWLHLAAPLGGKSDFQAYQPEQYLALILLLRHLCITHRIPRRFLGDTTEEKLMKWWDGADAETRSRLVHFRGILSHMNTSPDKLCGGPALNRNYLFRGIIDEWWLPVQCIGDRQVERPYYMGPIDPQHDQPSFFRWVDDRLHQELFHDANLDALQETKSYFDFDLLELYYGQTETRIREGTFPIGTNKVWHGGVHLMPQPGNRKVYAAASGTIVAARLGGNAAVEGDSRFGSQRFILIRHAVYIEQENDPDGQGMRINYTVQPKYFFTLYMHLAPFAPPPEPAEGEPAGDGTNPENPPWYNYWIRHKRDRMPADRNRDSDLVFNPDVDVMVGDWIGSCGRFRGGHVLHFEVMSRENLSMAPWDDDRYCANDDVDQDALCESAKIDQFVRDATGDGIDVADILRAAPDLRRVKAYFKSEWALAGEAALAPIYSDVQERAAIWERLQHFMWLTQAIHECPDLETQLCNSNGFMWHYHPITFMDVINRMIATENGQLHEPSFRNTNVTMENDYLHRFVDFSSGSPVDVPADDQPIRPYDLSEAAYDYRFLRQDMACKIQGSNHSPGPTPPTSTRFHTALLEVLRIIDADFSGPGRRIDVILSHVCNGHNVAVNQSRCCVGALRAHNLGLAIDIRPNPATQGNYQALVQEATAVCNSFGASLDADGGEVSRADLPEGFREVSMIMPDPNPDKKIHLELVAGTTVIVWEGYVRESTCAIGAHLQNNSIIAEYPSAEDTRSENNLAPSVHALEWPIRANSHAIAVRIVEADGEQHIIGVYGNRDEAEAESASGIAWPAESEDGS